MSGISKLPKQVLYVRHESDVIPRDMETSSIEGLVMIEKSPGN